MIRKIDVGSVFGNAQRTSYEYMKLLNNKKNGDFKTLVIDDKDGLHTLPFANHGSKVVMYEPNGVYINGGIVDNINITPITNRKDYNKVKDKIEIRIKNFYETRVSEKYDFVYCYRSLHEKHNKKIPMKRKIRKLLSSVKDDGYISLLCHQNGYCYATNSFLGKTLKVTPRTITRLIRELKDANLITISYTEDRIRRIYLV